MKFLKDLKNKNLLNKICLLRVDFNIQNADLRACPPKPWRRRGLRHGLTQIPPRVATILPTIKFLIKKGVKVVVLSHRGRPEEMSKAKSQKSKVQFKSQKLSLKPFVEILSKLLKKQIKFISLKELKDFKTIREKIQNSAKGSIFLAENLRFFPGEKKNSKKFARQLACLGDFYVNDAFSVSHRENASVAAITRFLPSYAGFCLEKEIETLSRVMKDPTRPPSQGEPARRCGRGKPLVIILGGAKVSDKMGVIKKFAKTADYFLTGGGVANTFFVAQKLPLAGSLYDKKMVPLARKLLRTSEDKIILPIDSIAKNKKILDIGPETVKMYAEIIKKAKTVIWSGPMGYIEDKKFAQGTEGIIKAIIKSRAFSVIGGGETIAAFQAARGSARTERRIFLSTGGGAMLDFLAGKKLPAIKALK